MAHKRMFSKDITTSDAFREMPTSSQALYFHLGMEADDDGFLDNYKGLMRAVNATDDDLRILIAKRFLILFPSKVVVVKHWLINNTVRKDRYNETKHLEEKRALVVKENGAYTDDLTGLPPGNQMATQYRIEEDRTVSEVEDDVRIVEVSTSDEGARVSKPKDDYAKHYEELCVWAEKRRGFKFVSRAKQYAAWKKARTNGIGPERMKQRWIEFEENDFYSENGFDWGTVISSFDKKK